MSQTAPAVSARAPRQRPGRQQLDPCAFWSWYELDRLDPARPADLATPPVPGVFFHASPTRFAAGEVLRPGLETGVTTTGDGQAVRLAPTPSQARSWALYIGRRLNLDAVAIYRVHVDALTGSRPDLRSVLPLPEFSAGQATVLELVDWVDPWAGVPAQTRGSLTAAPF